jgi:hypothetical protein
MRAIGHTILIARRAGDLKQFHKDRAKKLKSSPEKV